MALIIKSTHKCSQPKQRVHCFILYIATYDNFIAIQELKVINTSLHTNILEK